MTEKYGFTGFLRKASAFAAMAMMAGLLISRPTRAAEGDPAHYDLYNIEFKGTRHDRTVTDLNGDGLLDMAMAYSLSNVRDTYFLRVCVQEKGRGFTGNCKEMKFPEEARAFDVGETDGRPGAELVVLTGRGVKAASFSGGGFGPLKEVIPDRTILSGTEGDQPSLLRCLWDLEGDGRKEIILPTIKGPAIHKYGDGGYSLFQQIESPARITYRVGSLGDIMNTDDVNQFLRFRKYEQRTTAHFTAPDVFILDFDGDKKLDVVTLIDNTLKVFPQGPDGKFAADPVVDRKISILPPEEKGMGFAGEAMTFADLDNDGLMDIIMMKWGTSQERTQMDRYIYYARKGLKYPEAEKPDQVIRSESAAVDFGIYDLNNDQRLDLVIPFFHFAPAQAFKVMTENAIKVQFRLFIMKPDGRYSQDPGKSFARVDQRVLVNYKIDILGMIFDIRTLIEGNFFPLIAFGHDFNGDGYADLVADTGGDKLEFYYGNAEVKYSRQPDLAFDFESATDYNLADLNGDGKCDVVTYYESKERTKKKRELARKARNQPAEAPVETMMDEAAFTTPEGIRIKVLLSK
jgi:hypothetical protein